MVTAKCPVTHDPVTPGTGVYRIRRILGDHALRYMDENPLAAMRLSDPTKTRIHTIAYELDRDRAPSGWQQRLPDSRHHRLYLAAD